MLATFHHANVLVHHIIWAAQEQELAARIFQFIFQPALANGLRRNKPTDRKSLRHQHTFQRANTVGKDENIVTINEIVSGQIPESCNRPASRKLKIGLRAVARRSLARTLTVFLHPHGHITLSGQAVAKLIQGTVLFRRIKRITTQARNHEHGRIPSRSFRPGHNSVKIGSVKLNCAMENFDIEGKLGKQRRRAEKQE